MNDRIKDIEQALNEKYRREQTNLDLRKEKERLCNEMKVLDDINAVLNSTSHNKIGCPVLGEEVECREADCSKCKLKESVCKEEEPKVVERVVEKVIYREPEVMEEEKPRVIGSQKLSWFSKNKTKVYVGLLWIALIILAVGWSPAGDVFKEIQESYVNLLVDFFKMGIFGVAGFITYNLLKEDK